jgi:hypothetical protein
MLTSVQEGSSYKSRLIVAMQQRRWEAEQCGKRLKLVVASESMQESKAKLRGRTWLCSVGSGSSNVGKERIQGESEALIEEF